MIEFIRNFPIFIRYPVTKEFVKFCLVGLTNLAVDIFIYWVLTRYVGLYYILAAILSFIVAVSWSFIINRRWTFRHNVTGVSGQYAKFFAANSISIIIHLLLLFILVDWFYFNDLLAKLLVAVLVAFVNFSLNKLWTFNVKNVKTIVDTRVN